MSTTQTVDAVYEHGMLKPTRKLPFHERARLKLTFSIPSNPVRRTRGIIRISPQTARAIIYGTEFDLYGA